MQLRLTWKVLQLPWSVTSSGCLSLP
uniref:Uncharacterized protein n=1 Tax=Rhizophora mucronata TaxID=61149 RepID=A0A2P2NJH1_RHIMU